MSILNISDFGSSGSEAPATPNYAYTITLKDGTTHEDTGYFVINSLFVAICRGEEGVIYWAKPTDQFAGVVNKGPVTGGLEGWGPAN